MFEFSIEETPNPNARKYVFGFDVIRGGKKASFSKDESNNVPLASALLDIAGVEKLHFFDNFITITKNDDVDWENVDAKINEVLETMIDHHDPEIEILDEDAKRRLSYENMPANIRQINEILDRTVRPYLQMDGGDIQILKFDEEKRVFIRYEGACGGCPTSVSGTLYSIESILKSEMGEDVSLVIV